MQTTLIAIVVIVILGLGWIRFSPTDIDAFHVDPAIANDPGPRGHKVIGLAAPHFQGDPDTVLEALIRVARSEPRVRRLDGSVDEGMITFVARSKWIGFRDYITFKAVSEGSQTKLAAISRSRYEIGSDWGVNRERLERWFAEIEDVLAEG
ncbi:DUF1499 domain-containing protein [Boseongicola aestuarii]|uniref:DUF1499 domain-containing protein n=1 Tax=Boseongicola aestuarii TaxID=1470561 RepID=A0A238IVH3_9RHOB|nr:DUF1499 domain-containing protein [Boseongicola aestuarii]SMX22021.1 hypothetical protein BOA8489_00108 [Boseongicola aestuarii]